MWGEMGGVTSPCTPLSSSTPLPWSPPPCTALHPLHVVLPPTTHPDPPRTLERRKSTKILLSISTRFTLKMSLLFLLSVVEMVTCKGRGSSNYSLM